MLVGCFAIGQSDTASPGVNPAAQWGGSRQDQTPSRLQESSGFTESQTWSLKMLKQRRHYRCIEGSGRKGDFSCGNVAKQKHSLYSRTRKPSLEPGKTLRTAIKESDGVNTPWKVIQQLPVATTGIENSATNMLCDA